MIYQQGRTEAGASEDDLGAPFSLWPSRRAHLLTTRKWRWYCLRQSCALRRAARRASLPCPVWTGQQTPTAACASDAAAPITGGLGAIGHQQAAQGIYLCIACYYHF